MPLHPLRASVRHLQDDRVLHGASARGRGAVSIGGHMNWIRMSGVIAAVLVVGVVSRSSTY